MTTIEELVEALEGYDVKPTKLRQGSCHYPDCGGDGYLRDGPWGNYVPCPVCHPDSIEERRRMDTFQGAEGSWSEEDHD